jgi:hypothetical protein
MRLLIDTDAFCKLALGGLFRDSLSLLGASVPECGRLAALPHMLRRGRLRRTYGPAACDRMIGEAESLPIIGRQGDSWLDRLSPVTEIDPGEAQIFAAAAEAGLMLVSGDKRALRALAAVTGFPGALARRIVVIEALLLALCDHLGPDELRRRVVPLMTVDRMFQVCFSPSSRDPRDGLLSYYRSLADELEPLILWEPPSGGRE